MCEKYKDGIGGLIVTIALEGVAEVQITEDERLVLSVGQIVGDD